jgi:hypothetical protein
MLTVHGGADSRVMTMTHTTHRLSSMLAASLVLSAAACGGSESSGEPPATADVASSSADPTYRTQAFSLPFEITVPDWLPDTEASVDELNFVTWEPDARTDLAVRFLVPVDVFPPGGAGPIPTPDDYVAYLLRQREHGATFADIVETTVHGRPATLVTATVDESLDGSLGCPADDVAAPDCFGLQPDLLLRIAVIDAGETTLLAWLRHDGAAGTDEARSDIASFEAMLTTLRFRERGAAASETTATTATTATATAASPIDGIWTTSITFDQLAGSPLLLDADEVNDENWGELTFTFDHGRFALAQENPQAGSSMVGEFRVEGDTLLIDLDNREHFAMRWHVDGDVLTLVRDDALGIAPTPFVLQTWTRQP